MGSYVAEMGVEELRDQLRQSQALCKQLDKQRDEAETRARGAFDAAQLMARLRDKAVKRAEMAEMLLEAYERVDSYMDLSEGCCESCSPEDPTDLNEACKLLGYSRMAYNDWKRG